MMKWITDIMACIYSLVLVRVFYARNKSQFEENYGAFQVIPLTRNLDIKLGNESSILYGEIVKMITDLEVSPRRVFLPGETNATKTRLANVLKDKISAAELVTAGLGEPVDFRWDFEQSAPNLGKFSLIVSQAMIEHLVDPYKHLKDLAGYLDKGGRLIVHSVMPGFQYHRYPIDAIRFYPDWFEEIAKPGRLNLEIEKRCLRDFHIFYMYKRI